MIPCSFLSRRTQGFTRNLLLLFCRCLKALRFPGLLLLLIFHVWEHTLDISPQCWLGAFGVPHHRAAWSTPSALPLSSSRLPLPSPGGQHKPPLPPHTTPNPWGSGKLPWEPPQPRGGAPWLPGAAPGAAGGSRPPRGTGGAMLCALRRRPALPAPCGPRRWAAAREEGEEPGGERRGEKRRGGGGGRRPESFPG